MKTLEDYKKAVMEQPNDLLADKLIAEADKAGFTAWEPAELAGVRTELWP